MYKGVTNRDSKNHTINRPICQRSVTCYPVVTMSTGSRLHHDRNDHHIKSISCTSIPTVRDPVTSELRNHFDGELKNFLPVFPIFPELFFLIPPIFHFPSRFSQIPPPIRAYPAATCFIESITSYFEVIVVLSTGSPQSVCPESIWIRRQWTPLINTFN